jgi:UDPglucose 6-dehydrogenase
MKITVLGLGHVGSAMAVLLAQRHEVTAVDISAVRVADVSAGRSPVADPLITEFLATRHLSLKATTDAAAALPGSDFVIIATPTNYDTELDFFDTTSVEGVIAQAAERAPTSTVVIKSTIPVGFTNRMRREHPNLTILFSPEFLREGRALYDNLHPSRIVVADPGPRTPDIAG